MGLSLSNPPGHDVGDTPLLNRVRCRTAGTAPGGLIGMLRVWLAGQDDEGVDHGACGPGVPVPGQALAVLLQPLHGVRDGDVQVGAAVGRLLGVCLQHIAYHPHVSILDLQRAATFGQVHPIEVESQVESQVDNTPRLCAKAARCRAADAYASLATEFSVAAQQAAAQQPGQYRSEQHVSST